MLVTSKAARTAGTRPAHTRPAQVGTLVALAAGLFGCGGDKVAHFADATTSPTGDARVPETDGGGGTPAPVDAAPAPDLGPTPDAGLVPDAAVDAAQADAATADAAAADAGPPPDAGFEEPTGELPDFANVAVTTAGANSFVTWVSGGELKVRSFGADFAWAGDTTTLAAGVAAPVGLVADTFSEVPWVVWGTGEADPIRAIEADTPGVEPLTLQVTGTPLVTQLQGNLIVFGRAPGDAPDRPLAWQIVDPLVGQAGALHTFELSGQLPDAAGSLGDSAVVRFGATGQCIFFDGAGEPIGNFVCRPGKSGRISSDGVTAVLVFQDRLNGDFVWRVIPLLGGQGYTPYNLGKEDASGDTTDNAFPASSGTRPLLLAYRSGENAGNLGLFFPEPSHLFTEDASAGAQVDPWIHDGTRALIRRGTTALKVRFGYDDVPRLSTIALKDIDFSDTQKPYNFLSPNVDPACVPTLEDCDPDSDLDCDGIRTNGLCCAVDSLRWKLPFNPPAGVSKFAFGDATDRNAYFAAVEGTDGSITPYFVDFTDNDNNVSEANGFIRDLQRDPPQSAPQFDLSHAHGLVGFVQVHAWRGVIAHDENNQLGIFWNPPSIPRIAETRVFSPLDGCEDVLAYDRVMEDPYDHLMAAIVVCPDRILRVPPRALDGDTESVPLQAAGGIPVRAVWATTTRVNRASLMVVVAYQTAAGGIEFLRYLATPQAGPGAPAGIGVQVQGNNGPFTNLPDDDKREPIWWNVSNTAYVQIRGAGDVARARTPNGQGWEWQPVVVPGAVDHYEVADLNQQVVGGSQSPAGYAFYALSVGGDGGTNLWASQPSVLLPGVTAPLWHVTRGFSYDNFTDFSNGKLYPGVFAMYADPAVPGQWWADLSGATCTAP